MNKQYQYFLFLLLLTSYTIAQNYPSVDSLSVQTASQIRSFQLYETPEKDRYLSNFLHFLEDQKQMQGYYNVKSDSLSIYNYSIKPPEVKAKYDAFNTNERVEVDSLLLYKNQKLNLLVSYYTYKDLLITKKNNLFTLVFLYCLLVASMAFILYYSHRRKKTLALQYQIKSTKSVLEAKDKYLENLTHEVRTPITIINGYLAMLQKNALHPQKVIEFSELGMHSTKKLLDSLTNYLEFLKNKNRIIASNKNYKTSSISIVKEVKKILFSFVPITELGKMHILFKTNISKHTQLHINPIALEHILNNLISNAIKFSDMGGQIFVSVMYKPHQLFIQVKDKGVGMAEEDLKQIFFRFYQVEETALNRTGLGIGLFIVKELVAKLGGEINVKSKLTKGSSFKIQIPLTTKDHVEELVNFEATYKTLALENIDKELEKNTNKTENLPKILIVDDNFEMLLYLKQLFETNYACLVANNGNEALHILKNETPQLIISDVKMPILNGISFKEKLNLNERHKNIPFIIITALDNEYANHIQLKIGVDEWLIKPFSAKEIETRVLNLMKKQVYRQLIEPEENQFKLENDSVHHLLEKLQELIRNNLADEHYKISNLTKDIGYSQHQLNKVLKKRMGMTLNKLIIEIRLLTAYDHIVKQQKETLNEVIYAVGLNSRTYFNKRFYKRFGVKPGKLMKQNKQAG